MKQIEFRFVQYELPWTDNDQIPWARLEPGVWHYVGTILQKDGPSQFYINGVLQNAK